jgi:hypothetical protein
MRVLVCCALILLLSGCVPVGIKGSTQYATASMPVHRA